MPLPSGGVARYVRKRHSKKDRERKTAIDTKTEKRKESNKLKSPNVSERERK